MNWILIVFTATNFITNIPTDSLESCDKIGTYYNRGVEENVHYLCLNIEEVKSITESKQ